MRILACVALLGVLVSCGSPRISEGELLRGNSGGSGSFGNERISYPKPAEREMTTSHPRLIIDEERIAQLKQLIETDPVPREWLGKIRARADEMLAAPPLKFGKRPPV